MISHPTSKEEAREHHNVKGVWFSTVSLSNTQDFWSLTQLRKSNVKMPCHCYGFPVRSICDPHARGKWTSSPCNLNYQNKNKEHSRNILIIPYINICFIIIKYIITILYNSIQDTCKWIYFIYNHIIDADIISVVFIHLTKIQEEKLSCQLMWHKNDLVLHWIQCWLIPSVHMLEIPQWMWRWGP